MGTNFYVIHPDKRIHIGKRSGAGQYCFKCNITLCKDGPLNVHHTKNTIGEKIGWNDRCPICGDLPAYEVDYTIDYIDSGGITHLKTCKEIHRNTNVHYACSFNWAVKPDKWKELVTVGAGKMTKCLIKAGKWKCIKDENGKEYTTKEFENELKACPIYLTNNIGSEFS